MSSYEDRPPPDAEKLLAYRMEWEKGDTPPGRVISNLRTAGRDKHLWGATDMVALPGGRLLQAGYDPMAPAVLDRRRPHLGAPFPN